MSVLVVEHPESITIEDFLEACRVEVQVPLSEEMVRSVVATVEGVTFRRFRANSRALLNSNLFAASDTDRGRSRWLTAADDVGMDERGMITYAELMRQPGLLQDYLERLGIDRAGRPERPTPRVLTLHCAACDGRWLLDGNHGFVRICVADNHQLVSVTEMTGPRLAMRACRCDAAPPSGNLH